MKALVLTSVDGAIEFKETNDPLPTPGEVLIRLAAAALNRRDFWITRGGYPNIEAPCVLGSDGAGIVEKSTGLGGRVPDSQYRSLYRWSKMTVS